MESQLERDGRLFFQALKDPNKQYQKNPLDNKTAEFFGLKPKKKQETEDEGLVVEWADF